MTRWDITTSRTIIEPPTPNLSWHKQLAVWNSINPPTEMKYYGVKTVQEAKDLINELTAEQLKDDTITANAFGMVKCVKTYDEKKEYWDIYAWEEWADEEGNDIIAVMNNEEDEKDEEGEE